MAKDLSRWVLEVAERKASRKRQPESERVHWEHLVWAMKREASPSDGDSHRWALNCCLLMNGFSFHGIPLTNFRRTINRVKSAKRKPLPKAAHNMMILGNQDDYIRKYVSFLEGRWLSPR